MSSVSPSSSISQSVLTTGGINVEAPSRELLNRLAPEVAVQLLSQYYSAVVAASGSAIGESPGVSGGTSRSGSRVGKRERRAGLAARAELLRAKPGYCYTKLLSDAQALRAEVSLGPNPSLRQVAELDVAAVRDLDLLSELSMEYAADSYHVTSKKSGEPLPEFFRRCASGRRGQGRLIDVFGVAPFGAAPVRWEATVGQKVAVAGWTEPVEPGLYGFVVDVPFIKGHQRRVLFPAGKPSLVHIAEGVHAVVVDTGQVVRGPVWLEVGEVGGLMLDVKLTESTTAWWGAAQRMLRVRRKEWFGRRVNVGAFS